MASPNNKGVIFISLMIICLLQIVNNCLANNKGGIARKEDIPFIKCQVCEKLAKELYEQVKDKQLQISPKKVL